MAQVKIYGVREQLIPKRAALSEVIHSCVMDALGMPHDKRAHRFIPLEKEDFLMPGGRTEAYTIIELSMMIYRYIFVFLDQADRIHSAQMMRLGDASARSSLTSFAMLSSVLFLSSWEQGERLIVAMDSRCYDGKLGLMEEENKAAPSQIIAVALYLIATATISVLSRNVSLL